MEDVSLGLRLPLTFWLWLPPSCLSASRRGRPVCSCLALLWCRSILCSVSRPGCTLVRAFRAKVLSPFFFSLSLAVTQFRLLSHVSSLRLSSGHSGPVLTLSNAAGASLSSPCLLVADTSVWASSPLGIAVRRIFCGGFFSSPPSYVAL